MMVIALATTALAQTVATRPAPPPTSVAEVEVVTGSHIPQPNLTSVSPVTQIDSAEIRAQGVMRIEDAINQMPQAFVDQNSTVDTGETGTATVNLRGLGDERTLVLIDGKRLMPGDPKSGSVAPDLNFVPDALVDRIDIVTGGASAVYGSDAIGGVVNFIMKRNFSGLKMDAQAGVYTHHNGQTGIQAVLADQDQPEPPKTIADGLTYEVTVVAGVNAPDGRGNLTVYGGYRSAQAITEATRDFSACALLASGPAEVCAGSGRSTALGHFLVFDPVTFGLVGNLTLDPTGPGATLRSFDAQRDGFNFAPYQYFDRPDERYTAGVFARYQLRPAVELYVDGMFMYDDTVAQLASSGLFGVTLNIACSNPMLSAAEVRSFCTDAHVPPGGSALISIGRRDIEAGPRQYQLTHTDYRVVAGLRGAFGDWNYDVSAQVSAVAIGQSDVHDVSLSRAADALNVVRDSAGNLVCASGAPGCVPYDVFRIGGLTKAALAYIDTPASAGGGTDETVVSANLNGKLDRYGIRSPWSRDGVGVALGAEYRREGLSYSPDAELASGDLAGNGFASPAVSGHFDVYELYGEARAPLIQDRGSLLHDLTLDGAVRYSWYSNAGGAATYKAGIEWAPAQDLRLRASYNHAVRAPNVVDLFTPQTLNGGLDFDPCAGANPVADQHNPFATQANCARTGVTPAQYGHIVPSPEGAYNALGGGNPNLRPESADTVSLGFVLTPRAVPGFNLTVDYFDIKVNGVIGAIPPDLVIEQCLETGDPTLCRFIHRAPGTGSLWLTNDGYVSNLGENTASLETQGIDLNANFRHALPSWAGRDLGSASLRLVATYLMSSSAVAVQGSPSFDCAGYYGGDCGDPTPRWRHVLRATWDTPWNVDLSLAWRYVSQVTVSAASPNPILNMPFDPPDYRLASRSYIDMSLAWRINRRLEVRVGVNNLFDVDPPIIAADFLAGVAASSNTYPGLYDALGRWVFVGLSARL